MKNDQDISKILFLKRRSVILGWFKVSCIGVLILRLFKLQIIDGAKYLNFSKKNSIRSELLLPTRGDIFDRNGLKIATTQKTTRLSFYKTDKYYMKHIKNVFSLISYKPKNYDDFLKKIASTIQKYPRQKVVLSKYLTNKDIMKLKFNLPYLKGIEIETNNARYYPFDDKTSCLIGGVIRPQNVNNYALKNNIDYRVGYEGIEKYYEHKLAGKIGIQNKTINVYGDVVESKIMTNKVDGGEIITTIDQRLQSLLSDLLNGKSGATTLLDLKTGGILAMHSTPNINPNIVTQGIDEDLWKQITSKAGQSSGLFLNKNISSAFPPGSTFKVISSLTALVSGVDPDKKFNCKGEYEIGNRTFHCWANHGHGWLNMEQAIAQSCNCYFYHLSTKVNVDDVYDMAIKMGLGQRHFENFNNEVIGNIPNSFWKQKKYNQKWYAGDNANLIIGQGYTTTTILQLAVMAGRLATNLEIQPTYFLNQTKSFNLLGINNDVIEYVKKGLWSVINAPFGLVYGVSPISYGICGKTGSSQVVSQRIENKDMRSGAVAKEKHSHALFVGFAPYDNPRYSIAVIVEHGIGGARSAVPIGVRMLKEAIDLEKKNSK